MHLGRGGHRGRQDGLAKEIAKRLNLPHCELDQMRMHAEGRGSSEETFQSGVAELALADQWIIDGHYRAIVRCAV